MLNALSIDVEDYWSILARDWLHIDAEPSGAVERNTKWFLDTLAEHSVKATFFILGEVAEKFPALVAQISKDGHEIGVHGFYHRQIFKITEQEFAHEVGDAKKLLEDIASVSVLGHRAPAFSVNSTTQWALEVLAREGFEYDSSISPMAGKRYGWPGFHKGIHRMQLPSGRSIIEVPMSTVTLLGKELVVGGGYIRHFPYAFTKWAIKYIQRRKPVIIYMHPYEIDTEHKPFSTEHLSQKDETRVIRFHKMQLRNRKSMPYKVHSLLSQFKFTTISEVISRTLVERHSTRSTTEEL